MEPGGAARFTMASSREGEEGVTTKNAKGARSWNLRGTHGIKPPSAVTVMIDR
jgi:hypothetical protein